MKQYPSPARRILCMALLGLVWTVIPVSQGKSEPFSKPPGEITLQLLWEHQFQFAGFYAAREKGFYLEEGLNVRLRDGGYHEGKLVNPVEEVLFNRAQFGITRSDLLLYRANHLPVVMLAPIFQQSPFILLSTESCGIKRLEDIGQKPTRIKLAKAQHDYSRIDVETLAMLRHAGVDYHSLNNRAPDWDLAKLARGENCLVPGYSIDDPYRLQQLGAKPSIIKPNDYGINFYGDLLFTSEQLLKKYPSMVAAFRRASLKGWQYAMQHPEEIIQIIKDKYLPEDSQYTTELLHYQAEQTRHLIQPELVEIGYSNPQRWQQIAQIFHELNITSDDEIDSGFFYQPPDLGWYEKPESLQWLVLSILALLLLSVVTLRYVRLNHHLRHEIEKRNELEAQLQRQAITDPLTGIYNRRHLMEVLANEVERFSRYQRPFSLAILDIDNFKTINDQYGHDMGDKVLCHVVGCLKSLMRKQDTFARIGGEEFCLLMPETTAEEANQLMERIRQKVFDHVFVDQKAVIQLAVSIGISQWQAELENASTLLQQADSAMYHSKHLGKNRVTLFADMENG